MARQVVSVLGLRSMGLGIACSALAGGHNVFGFDVNAKRQANFIAKGGQVGTVTYAVERSDVVVLTVLNSSQTEDVLF